ncbi:hypothetical protein K432DRAFT_333262 [Lepidopterella palustris CBS 459.81]|uniref:F-box domain-containing protein n=1 Tax=Lepidopterella palustris CBS 459.81 TaxID=1314670 RepID=A0A8E2E5I1_9PEZI|nr:hypothetical protein K432DRAFT_333262 [Lepidopterella palustris CBS 459.81]
MKRPRDKSEPTLTNSMDLMNALAKKGAVSIFLYHKEYPNPEGTDVWPDIRDGSKIPARYFRLSGGTSIPAVAPDKSRGYCLREPLRPNKILKLKAHSPQQIQQPRKGWPASVVPTEMFEEIARYLSRDDIKSMRLVCREFDRHVSQVLFNTVVVPFNTEIYGMLGTDKKPDIKGKGKVKMEVNKPLSWKNANGDDVYNGHGLDVFRGFGPHIRKYGMSFDVDEDALAKPPYKGTTQGYVSFWGTYDWPFEEYRRFDDVAGLELAADETPRMKTAFSMLQRVQELAFSVDSGLGWLRGPDRSIRARVLQRSPQVFGSSKNIPDRKTQAQKELWDYIEATHRDVELDVKLATLYRMDLSRPFSELQSVLDSKTISSSQPRYPFMDLHLIGEATPDDVQEAAIPSFDDLDSLEAFIGPHQTPATGILYSATSSPNEAAQLKSSIIPAQLTKAQKEWLLETEWAQRAFLSSYMLAVIDNPSTFERVHTLNIARVSSRYTFSLCRQDFWDALPQLKTVTIQVIPDWRGVLKDEAGFVETPRITPAQAIGPFHQLLKEMISPRANIQALTIGWAAGGEHAEGVHARNKHILPAPVLPDHASLLLFPSQLSEHMLYLPHVKKLTLKNCWITPPALQQVVETHEKTKLENLVLDSVSLTATPRTLANQNQNQNQNFNLQANPPPAIAPQQANAAGNLANALQNVQNAHAQQVPGHHLAPQHLLALQIQALQLQIQHLQTQQTAHAQTQINSLQAQMQTQVHLQAQLHAHGMAMNPPPQAPPPQQFTPQSAVRANHREGSWPYIIDIISPGQSLAAFGSDYSNADPDRITTLNQLEFISCGYVRLPHANIDQAALEPAVPMIRLPHFTKRYNALVPAMLSSKDPLLGEIIQEVEPVEVAALNAAWFLVPGWRDQFEAKGPEFDGLLPGGSGRFSGIIKKGDRGVIDGEDGLRG